MSLMRLAGECESGHLTYVLACDCIDGEGDARVPEHDGCVSFRVMKHEGLLKLECASCGEVYEASYAVNEVMSHG